MHEKQDVLENECIAYSQYLIRKLPNRYVIDKYCEAHKDSRLLPNVPEDLLDRFLWKIPNYSFFLRLVDVFTLVFARQSILRKKWLLLIGILESSEPASSFFDQPDSMSRPLLIGTILCSGILFVFYFALSTILIGIPALLVRIYERIFCRSH